MPDGSYRKAQFGQGVISWEQLRRGRVRNAATGYAVRGQSGVNRVERVSVRPVVAVGPEHVEAAALLPLFNGYAAVEVKQPEPVIRYNRRVKEVRSALSLRNVKAER